VTSRHVREGLCTLPTKAQILEKWGFSVLSLCLCVLVVVLPHISPHSDYNHPMFLPTTPEEIKRLGWVLRLEVILVTGDSCLPGSTNQYDGKIPG
jgi:hypothetical protein